MAREPTGEPPEAATGEQIESLRAIQRACSERLEELREGNSSADSPLVRTLEDVQTKLGSAIDELADQPDS